MQSQNNKKDVIPNGKLIRQKRIECGFTQKTLADNAKIVKSTIERIEKSKPTHVSTLSLVAQALGLGSHIGDLITNPDGDTHELVTRKIIDAPENQEKSRFQENSCHRSLIDSPHPTREFEPTKTWQELYRDCAIGDAFADADQWYDTLGREVTDDPKDLTMPKHQSLDFMKRAFELSFVGEPMALRQMVDKHKNVLLSGIAGSGKTTAFKLLATSWLSEYDPLENPQLAFYIKLSGIESLMEKTPDWKRTLDIPELIGWTVTETLRDKCSTDKLENCEIVKRLSQKGANSKSFMPLTREDILKSITDEVSAWFRNGAGESHNTLILIDGINELRPQHRNPINNKIETLLNRGCHVVLSCRSNLAGSLFSEYSRQFTRFELQELEKEQIIVYLNYHIHGKGKQIFESQFQDNPRLFSMARNPFFLYLTVKKLERDEKANIPSNKAQLIDDFVSDCIKRKHKDGVCAEETAGVKDDTVHTVLSEVSKWSISALTAQNDDESFTFRSSQEYKEAKSSPDEIYRALEGAKCYGLLASSGLSDEDTSRGYPIFIHEYIRDYFAAVYLKNMGSSSLEQLQKLMEYIVWDEPILLFLELCGSKNICQSVTEFALSHDHVFAALCTRHARIIETGLCIRAANTVAKSPLSSPAKIFSLHRRTFEASTRKIHFSLPAYGLGRLPIREIIDIARNPKQSINLQDNIWAALVENTTSKDLPMLKDFWKTLSQTPDMEHCFTLWAIAQIPTQEAFNFLANAYKSLGKISDLMLSHIFLGVFYTATYSPSLTEIVLEFPPERAPSEFTALLPKVTKLDPKEIALLENLIFTDHSDVVSEASKLLARIAQKQAFPTLLKRLESLSKGKNQEHIRNTLITIFEDIAPEKAVELVIAEREATDRERVYGTKERPPSRFLRLLAANQPATALKYLVSSACQMDNGILSGFCADQLENWPNRDDVLSAIKHYGGGSIEMDTQKLLYAWLGEEGVTQVAPQIFDELFSLAVLKRKNSPPIDPVLRSIYDRNPKHWHKYCEDQALETLPLAVRAMRKVATAETAAKILSLIEWEHARMVGREKHNLLKQHISFHLVADSLFTLTTMVRSCDCEDVLDQFIGSPLLKDLLRLITEDGDIYTNASLVMLAQALIHFCDNISEHYVPAVFSAACQQFQKSLIQIPSGHKVDLEHLFELLVCLSKRSSDDSVVDFLRMLSILSKQVKDEDQLYISALLAQAIKFAKGRRFLTELAV